MRMSRLRKFKNRKKFILLCKITAITYLIMFSFSYAVSSTGAYFNSENEDRQVIQAGTWWDGSSLVFVNHENDNMESCGPTTISAQIKNTGFSMYGTSNYEVYQLDGGKQKVADGVINKIEENKTDSLTFSVPGPGSYQFKAYQRPGFDDDYDNRTEIWSGEFTVACKEEGTVGEEKDGERGQNEDKDTSTMEPSENESNESNESEQTPTKEEDNKTTGQNNDEYSQPDATNKIGAGTDPDNKQANEDNNSTEQRSTPVKEEVSQSNEGGDSDGQTEEK